MLRVRLAKKKRESYGIVIARGLSKRLAREILNGRFGNAYCIIADSNVAKRFGAKLVKQFRKAGEKAELVSFPAGEKSKNMKTLERVLEKMLAKGFDRKSCVIALGGGVTGDVAGFAASVYLRGVNYVQVPTTLLAMVDSSVGGKTGVNLSRGKNSAGTFYQPKKVYVCTEFLDTLSRREVSNGMAEVVKHAVIADKNFFSFLEKNIEKILKKDARLVPKVVKLNCAAKARVVERDEREANYRRIVNFGHTIGHAIEVLGNYRESTHGEAISIGMACEAELSRLLGMMKAEEVQRLTGLLLKAGLPVKLPKGKKYRPKKVLAATRHDKKSISGKTYYSLPQGIGRMHSTAGFYGFPAKDSDVLKALGRCS